MKTWRRTVLLAVCAALLFSGMPRAAGKAEALPELAERTFTVRVNPSEETLAASMRETGDPSLAWVAEIPCSLLTGGGENGSDE